MKCRCCLREFKKPHPDTVQYFCSKDCRKAFRHPYKTTNGVSNMERIEDNIRKTVDAEEVVEVAK